MKETPGPPLRAAALAAFITGLVMFLLNAPSFTAVDDLVGLLGGIVAIVVLTAAATVRLIGKEMPEREFRRIVDRSEALAKLPPAELPPSEFDELVIDAIDRLPEDLHEVIEEIPIVVSHLGHEHSAYGHYIGDTVARDNHRDHILIYQDTLERDFGHDPDLLRAQVQRTVRHEIAHHLGWDERGVRNLGL